MTSQTFTGPLEREATISADRSAVMHQAGAWSTTYQVTGLPRWIAFHGERATVHPTYAADVEVLKQAQAGMVS